MWPKYGIEYRILHKEMRNECKPVKVWLDENYSERTNEHKLSICTRRYKRNNRTKDNQRKEKKTTIRKNNEQPQI